MIFFRNEQNLENNQNEIQEPLIAGQNNESGSQEENSFGGDNEEGESIFDAFLFFKNYLNFIQISNNQLNGSFPFP